jgi:hypothetical protein
VTYAGRGPDAAALTSFARYTLRALARRDPAAVLHRITLGAGDSLLL